MKFLQFILLSMNKKESRFVSNPRPVGNVRFDEYDDNMYNAKLSTSQQKFASTPVCKWDKQTCMQMGQ